MGVVFVVLVFIVVQNVVWVDVQKLEENIHTWTDKVMGKKYQYISIIIVPW